jgi:ATP synthase delta/epsilon subunit-like protein
MSDAAAGVEEQKSLDDAAKAPASQQEQEEQTALKDYSQKTAESGRPVMRVKLYSPFHEYFDGPAQSVGAENATGPFDILPHHHNFISLLQPCDVVVRRTDQDDRRFRISGGLMHVKADQVVIFLDV